MLNKTKGLVKGALVAALVCCAALCQAAGAAGGPAKIPFARALVSSVCASIMSKETYQAADGTVATTVIGSNKDIHACQYTAEMDAHCLDKRQCPSYAAWSARHAEINPYLPRAIFLQNIEDRQWQLAIESYQPGDEDTLVRVRNANAVDACRDFVGVVRVASQAC